MLQTRQFDYMNLVANLRRHRSHLDCLYSRLHVLKWKASEPEAVGLGVLDMVVEGRVALQKSLRFDYTLMPLMRPLLP